MLDILQLSLLEPCAFTGFDAWQEGGGDLKYVGAALTMTMAYAMLHDGRVDREVTSKDRTAHGLSLHTGLVSGTLLPLKLTMLLTSS